VARFFVAHGVVSSVRRTVKKHFEALSTLADIVAENGDNHMFCIAESLISATIASVSATIVPVSTTDFGRNRRL